jgi:uncharacterized protein YfaS (alpha-2-macroglobulin family)
LFNLKRYREALDALSNLPDKHQTTLVYIAAAHAYLGESAQAAKALQEAKQSNPAMGVKEASFQHAGDG